MENEEKDSRTGHISDVGLLDLRYAKSPEDLAHIKSISDVGAVLVPERLLGVLGSIDIEDVGGVIGIPDGTNVNCQTGQIYLTGEALASGDSETILVLAGQIFISGEVTQVGYKEIRLFGQLFAPRSGQSAISAKLGQMTGQTIYTPSDPRVLMGNETIGEEYLQLLPGVTALVVMGNLQFEKDVTKDSLKSKISEIVLMGKITAPKELIPLVQVLTKTKMGEIAAEE